MEILETIPTNDINLTICLIGGFITLAYVVFVPVDERVFEQLLFRLVIPALLLMSITFGLAVCFSKSIVGQEKYKVKFNETYSVQELIKNYNIISCDGETMIIQEK